MTDWLIVITRQAKEQYVAAAIERLGYPAWVPVEIQSYRTNKNHRSRHRTLVEDALLPKYVFAGVPVGRQGLLSEIRYAERLKRNEALVPLQIPGWQIDRFRAALDEINAAQVARAKLKPAKKVWRQLADLREAMLTVIHSGGDPHCE